MSLIQTLVPLLTILRRPSSMSKTLDERAERDQISGFDVNGSSNGVPRLGGTVDFLTLVAGPGMVVTSSSSLGASTTAGVHGVAKRTSWEGDMWVVPWIGVTSVSRKRRELSLMCLPFSYRCILIHYLEAFDRPCCSR